MKLKSYIVIAVPPGESERTNTLFSELRNEMSHLDFHTEEAADGQYRAASRYIHQSGPGGELSCHAAMSATDEIIYRMTGCVR